MKQQYSYISSIDFINDLQFEYIETYSLQRAVKYEERAKKEFEEFKKFKKQKDENLGFSESDEIRFEELNKLYGVTQYLINSEGLFHPSAEKTGTFKKNDFNVIELIKILNIEIKEIPSWMCAPVYRDAIVFYNSEKVIQSVLNVCLSCEYIETKMFNYINADSKTYKLLREFFISIGHKVEKE